MTLIICHIARMTSFIVQFRPIRNAPLHASTFSQCHHPRYALVTLHRDFAAAMMQYIQCLQFAPVQRRRKPFATYTWNYYQQFCLKLLKRIINCKIVTRDQTKLLGPNFMPGITFSVQQILQTPCSEDFKHTVSCQHVGLARLGLNFKRLMIRIYLDVI